MATLDQLADLIREQNKRLNNIEGAVMVPLNDEGRRVFGTGLKELTIGQAMGGAGLASRRLEVVLAVQFPDATNVMRQWASHGAPKPGLEPNDPPTTKDITK